MQWMRLLILTLFLGLTVTGCGSGSDDSGSNTAPSTGGDGDGDGDSDTANRCGSADSNGVITCDLDASSYDDFVYFDATEGKVVTLTEAQASTSTNWHFALRRYAVKLNGGESGPGNAGGGLVAPQDDFYNSNGDPNASVFTNATAESEYEHLITELTEPDNWTQDSIRTSFDVDVVEGPTTYDYGWYIYNLVSGNISANPDNGWLLRSGEGNSYARMRVTGLSFPTRAGNGVESFEFSFDVQPANTSQFTSTATFTGSIPGEGGEVCFDFDSDQTVACSGSQWDLKIGFVGRDFYLRSNSGISGEGEGGGLGPFAWSELAAYTSATTDNAGTSLSTLYVEDTTGGIFDDQSWYAYNVQEGHKLWPNYRVYMLTPDIDDESSPRFAVQIIDYYNDIGESGHLSFRFRPVSTP